MLNFEMVSIILGDGLGLVSPPQFGHGFSRKIFSMLYSTNWLYFIVWLSLLIEILGNMCIVIISFPIYDTINFEIDLRGAFSDLRRF